jgi:oxygen-dependent protoporphyrinogen oxidase
MKRVTVVGGGFSGLATAYYLARAGADVTLLEKQPRLGGFVDTLRTPHGLVETAASGITNSGRLEALCADLDLSLVHTKKESRKRYLFRGEPRQWPLGIGESAGFAGHLGASLVTRRFRPRDGEPIEAWGRRVLGPAATHFILAAALQGIYAGDPAALSASLIFRKTKPPKPSKKGLVAPPEGLAQLTAALAAKIEALGGTIRTGATVDELPDGTVVLATSIADAGSLLRARAPETARALAGAELVPLVRVTAFYPSSENTVPGFGVLFPRGEGVRALGVLFNTNIFPNRGEGHSESWIYAGAQDREILDLDDAALFEAMDRDRETLYGRAVEPLARYPQRWPVGLPHYTVALEALAPRSLPLPKDVFLVGNYLRGIGLPMLLEQAYDVAIAIVGREPGSMSSRA